MERMIAKMMVLTAMILIPAVMVIWIVSAKIEASQPQTDIGNPGVPRSMAALERDVECMTRNIYYEAATEPAEGKMAVAQVTMNRVAHSDFPDDVCEVVYQKTRFSDRTVCQFSWYCDGSPQRVRIRDDLWMESRAAAKKVMIEGWRLPSLEHALYYHADYVNPGWRKDKVAKIGRHIFYQDRDA